MGKMRGRRVGKWEVKEWEKWEVEEWGKMRGKRVGKMKGRRVGKMRGSRVGKWEFASFTNGTYCLSISWPKRFLMKSQYIIKYKIFFSKEMKIELIWTEN